MFIEQRAEYSTNCSDVKVSELMQAETEERIKALEKKVEELFSDKLDLGKQLQRVELENKLLTADKEDLQNANKSLRER